MLNAHGVPMEAKAFAVGVRVEHPQELIDRSQYGTSDTSHTGPAPYKLTNRCRDGRGVYSFRMCPGGYVVNASSEPGHLAVNGMSYHARDGINANSAIVVTVGPDDFLPLLLREGRFLSSGMRIFENPPARQTGFHQRCWRPVGSDRCLRRSAGVSNLRMCGRFFLILRRRISARAWSASEQKSAGFQTAMRSFPASRAGPLHRSGSSAGVPERAVWAVCFPAEYRYKTEQNFKTLFFESSYT